MVLLTTPEVTAQERITLEMIGAVRMARLEDVRGANPELRPAHPAPARGTHREGAIAPARYPQAAPCADPANGTTGEVYSPKRKTRRAMMKILMVLTSHDRLGDTGRKTGFWLEELAAPYYVFKDAGAEVVLVSPKGGHPPLDPKSAEPSFQTDTTRRFEADAAAMAVLAETGRLDAVGHERFDAVFYPGGHGPLWDLAEDLTSIKLIEMTLGAGKPLALVCHAPGVLRHAKAPDGKPLVEGRNVTGFTNTEEEAVGLTQVVPFLVEDELKRNGGLYAKGADWEPFVVTDGLLITGQNPASSGPAAECLVARLANR